MVRLLAQAQLHLPAGSVRLKLVDATVLTQPGSRGADWRLHLSFDLGANRLDQAELTDGRAVERLDRFRFHAGEIAVMDRGYALAGYLAPALAGGVGLIVRSGWNRLRMEQADGQPCDLVAWLQGQPWVPHQEACEMPVWIPTAQGRFPVRLVAQALSESATQQARRRVRREAQKTTIPPMRAVWSRPALSCC